MTSKLVVNTIEADTGISSVSFASSISMNSTAKFHFSAAGVDIGADTNINRPAAGVLAFNINSSEKVRINSNGQLGIGTDNPNQELTVYGDEPNFRLTHTGSTNKFNALYTNVNGTGVEWNSYQDGTGTRRPFIFKQYTTEVLRIDSSGRLLIGTTTEGHAAADELTISNTTSAADMGITLRSATNGQGAIYFSDGTSGDAEYRGIINYNHTSDFLSFYTAATQRLRISSSGKVGIDMTNPDAYDKFVVSGTGNVIAARATSGAAGLGFYENNTGRFFIKSLNGSDGISFVDGDNSSERLRITSGGMVGIAHHVEGQIGKELTIRPANSGGIRYVRPGETSGSPNIHLDLTTTTSGSAFPTGEAYTVKYKTYNCDQIFETYEGGGTGGNISFRTRSSSVESVRINKDGYVTKPNQPMFAAHGSGDAIAAATPLPFDSIVYNIGSHYNNSTHKFTCPVAGYYYVTCHVVPTGFSNSNQNVELYVQNTAGSRFFLDRKVKTTAYASNNFSVGGSRILYAAANDTFCVEFNSISGSSTLEGSSHFGIMLMA